MKLLRGVKTAEPFQRKLKSRSDVKGRRPVPKLKKRHVEERRAFQQNVWQLLVGTFIVVKSAPPQTAPMLEISSLQASNSKMYQQLIHNALWMSWG